MRPKIIPYTIVGLALAWWIVNKLDVIELSGCATLRTQPKDVNQNINQKQYDIEGDYVMIEDFKGCHNVDFAFSNLKTYSDIRLNQISPDSVSGTGIKTREIKNGIETKYSKRIDIYIEGTIRNDSVVVLIREIKSNKEVVGRAKFDLSKNKNSYSGKYEALGANCNTDITLNRKINK